jgi:hypothetical protein
MAVKIYASIFGEEDSPVTITGHSLRLYFKKTGAAFQQDSQNKYHHKDSTRYIGRIRVTNLDTNGDYTLECESGCTFVFEYIDGGGTTGTLTVDHTGVNGSINIEWNNINFPAGAPPFVINNGALQPDIEITDANGVHHTLPIDNPANCQVVLSLKH